LKATVVTLFLFPQYLRVQENIITNHSVKDPVSLGRKIACSVVTAKGNVSNTVPETARSLEFNTFTLSSDTVSCGVKAVTGIVFGVPSVTRVVLY
jgi:hypothetical protein